MDLDLYVSPLSSGVRATHGAPGAVRADRHGGLRDRRAGRHDHLLPLPHPTQADPRVPRLDSGAAEAAALLVALQDSERGGRRRWSLDKGHVEAWKRPLKAFLMDQLMDRNMREHERTQGFKLFWAFWAKPTTLNL